MAKLSDDAKEAVQNEVRRILQQELMQEVRDHRTFLGKLSERTIKAISIVFAVVIAAFFFYLGRTVNEAKSAIFNQIDSKIIDYRIVEVNRKKTNEFAEVAVTNSKIRIDGELNTKLDSVMKVINNEVSKAITVEMLSAIQKEIEKIDQMDVDDLTYRLERINENINGININVDHTMGGLRVEMITITDELSNKIDSLEHVLKY